MPKLHAINARHIAMGLISWLTITNVLVGLVHYTGWWPCKILLFMCLLLLPGAAILRALRIELKNATASLLYSFGLSILVLMLSGLAANQFLYMLGVHNPLEIWGALGAWNVVTALCITAATITNHRPMQLPQWTGRRFSKTAWLLCGLSFTLPFGAMLGAFRLNNGSDALVSMITLCFAAVLIITTILLRKRLPDGLIAWLIFVIGLSLLLMTSLRGWDIVGHDIEREFRVFTLTHLSAHWDIALDRNPYNACLSITILPEMLVRLLDVPGLIVFKVILQIIFAACPVVIYLLLRQYLSKLGALVGSLLFICYPTFINDSAMLTRQSVAYLFFALALLMMTNKIQLPRYKMLFLLCATGAILSHYSTAYVFVALFAAAVIFKMCITWWWRRRSLAPLTSPTVLSPLFAGLLFLITFVWYTQITATSSGLMATLQKSLANIPALFSDDNKSSDTAGVLFFSGGKTQIDLYESYLEASQSGGAALTLPAEHMPQLTSDDLPLTPLGQHIRAAGLDPSFIIAARQHFARFLQLLAGGGVVYIGYLLLRRKLDALNADFVCLSMAGIILLALLVVLPFLSINYGILRAFHQALIFLLLPMMLLVAWASRWMRQWLRTALAGTAMVTLFLMFSGVLAQLFGGVAPSLSMNNRGLYYGLYYSPAADRRAFTWLTRHVPKNSDVRAANFNRAFMHNPVYPFSQVGVLPSQISEQSYIYLDQAQVLRQKLYANHESSPLILTFPLNYYDAAKDQIYSTTSTRIYR